jgi:membrane protease YdiL (CAAX protease family)
LKDAARLLLYLLGVAIAGALLAAPLFWLGQMLITRGVAPALARYDFESYFHRAIFTAALIFLFPLFRSLRIRSWADLELRRNPRRGADFVAGFAIAAIPLFCCAAVLLAISIYSLRPHFLWSKLPTVLVAASVVPILEELFFRGFVLGVLLRSCSRAGAVLLTSAFFALVHFMKSPERSTSADAVNWTSGFVSLAHSFSQFGQPSLILGGLLTLFAIACILADARLQTHSLFLPIGMHAGWIFANGLFSRAAHRDMQALPWLGNDLLVGIVPLSIALLSWALVRGWVHYAGARSSQSIPRTR